MIKQCMPVNEQIVSEKLTEDDVNETLNPGSAALDQTARFYPGKVIHKNIQLSNLNRIYRHSYIATTVTGVTQTKCTNQLEWNYYSTIKITRMLKLPLEI